MSTKKDETDNKKTDDKDNAKQDGEKKTLSIGGKGTLSLGNKVSSPLKSRTSPNTISVEVRRSSRNTGAGGPANASRRSQESRVSDAEREKRAKAILDANKKGETEKSALPKRVTLDDAKKKEEHAKRLAEAEKIAEEKRQKKLAERASEPNFSPAPSSTPAPPSSGKQNTHNDEDKESYRDKLKKTPRKPANREIDRFSSGRITVNQAVNRDYERDRGPSLAAQKRAREKARLAESGGMQMPKEKIVREVIVPEAITVQELANRMAEGSGDVVKALMKMGVMATITQTIDADTAELLIEEFGHKIKRVTDADVEIGLEGEEDNLKDLQPRPPIVTIMGHVDHGKTSLLDALRQTDVVAGEAGGITQHIGAYQVTMPSKQKITFLDTPGHEAFTEMRSRGANVTDIVVIVVSAADSVMPQTIEAINHAKAAKVPIIIAINKIDLPEADPMKVKTELLQYEVVVEDLSGEVQCVEVSAKAKTNLDKLEEAIILQAEILELKANPNREAQGFVVESKMEKGRGAVGTILIQRGTLEKGDNFVAGTQTGRVRAIINDKGKQIKKAIPGQPVEVLGFNGVPEAGDMFNVVKDDARAREIAEYRQKQQKDKKAAMAISGRTTIDDLLTQRDAGEKPTLPVIIKADVHGSIEAIVGSFNKMMAENEDIAVQVLHTGVGGITESDVSLAKASGGFIFGFNVRANAQAREMAQREDVDIKYYNIIYDLIDDTKAMLSGMLSPLQREEHIGNAAILQVFNITKVGKVAGCNVTNGVVKRGSGVRLLRDNVVIHEGKLKTLKRHQDEVKEVKEGMECGMAFENYDDIKEGDVIECFEVIEEQRTVE